MTLTNIDHIKAMQVCQAQRFCVNFDDTLKNILRSYWDIVGARRSIAAQAAPQNGTNNGQSHLAPAPAKQKRGIEDTRDDEDMDMDNGMEPSDALRFTRRDVTPFQDR
jgi:serine/threonine/tyrosine-interacting protein